MLERALAEARDSVTANNAQHIRTMAVIDRRIPLTAEDKELRAEYELAQELLTQERVTDAVRDSDYAWAQGL